MAIIDLNTGELTTEQPATQPAAQPTAQQAQVTGGIIDLNTGDFVTGAQQEQAAPNDFGFLDAFTGSERIAQNPELGTLPEFGATEQGDTFKIAMGLLSTANPTEQQDIIKSIIPEAEFETLTDGTVIVNVPNEEGIMQRSVLNRPGISPQDLTTGITQVLAFVPAAKIASFGKSLLQKVGIGAFTSAATEAARQEATIAQGSEQGRSPADVAIAGTLGGLSETILPAIQGIRGARRASAIGAETDEVARAIESIEPTKQAQQGLEQATGIEVPLFQAQQTQIPSELLKQRVLPQLDASARTAASALEKQNKAVFDATTELVNTIAPSGTIIGGSKKFLTAAKGALTKAVEFRSESVKPLYQEAFKAAKNSGQSVNLKPVTDFVESQLKGLVDDDPAAIALKSFGKRLKGKEKVITTKGALGSDGVFKPATREVVSEPLTLQQLQSAKRTVDAKIDSMGTGLQLNSAQKNAKRLLVEAEKRYMGQIGEVNPQFAAANQEFARLSQPISELEGSLIGQIAKLDDTQLKGIAQKIFDPKAGLTDPSAIIKARKVIDAIDPEAWDQLLRVEMNRRIGSLEQLIEEIPGDFVGNIPGQLRRTLFGNPQQRKALMSAMSPEQRTNFKYLETVLKRASSGRAAGSPTAAFGQAIEKLKGVSSVIRDAIFKPLSTLQQTGERGIFDRNTARLAEVMFDPKFKPQLNKLRKLNPDSPAAARAMAQLLNIDSEADTNKGNK